MVHCTSFFTQGRLSFRFPQFLICFLFLPVLNAVDSRKERVFFIMMHSFYLQGSLMHGKSSKTAYKNSIFVGKVTMITNLHLGFIRFELVFPIK